MVNKQSKHTPFSTYLNSKKAPYLAKRSFQQYFSVIFCTHISFSEYNNIFKFQIHTSKIRLSSNVGHFLILPYNITNSLVWKKAPYLAKHSFQQYFSVIFCTHISFSEYNNIVKFQIHTSKIRLSSNLGHFLILPYIILQIALSEKKRPIWPNILSNNISAWFFAHTFLSVSTITYLNFKFIQAKFVCLQNVGHFLLCPTILQIALSEKKRPIWPNILSNNISAWFFAHTFLSVSTITYLNFKFIQTKFVCLQMWAISDFAP